MDNPDRPEVCRQVRIRAELLAQLIDQAPARIRKRLDRDPALAHAWTWSAESTGIAIQAGDETVRLDFDTETKTVSHIEQLGCSCLLSPKCFHLLACASCLTIQTDAAEAETATADADEPDADVADETPLIEVTDAMRDAADRSISAIGGMLDSGARRCGVVLQSSLLRAAHQCRAAGLIQLSAALLSVVEGVVRLRAQSGNADAPQLQSDLARAIVIAQRICRRPSVEIETIGHVRRPFEPIGLSRLVSLLAEPIVTRSGYAGVCVSLLADDDRIYQVSDVRPGEPDLALQAYRGGLELGGTTVSAFELCRSGVDVQNMTASPDRRLGRGSKTRWALRKQTGDLLQDSPLWRSRFGQPIAEQVDRAFAVQESSGMIAAAESDLVVFHCQVLGRQGDAVMVRADDTERPLMLRIALDTDQVPFRENLSLIARSPGLELVVTGRVRRHQAGSIDALAIRAAGSGDGSNEGPRLALPESWQNVCQLGLDRLERHFFSDTDPDDETCERLVGDRPGDPTESRVNGVPGLARQQLALVLGGRGSVASPTSGGHRRMIRTMKQQLLPTAAKLADAVATAAVATKGAGTDSVRTDASPGLCELLAATDRYQTIFRGEYHRQAWQDWLS
ncbi:hypothetical protein Mal15_02570 [Stieleria maiorica]|uniref:SWIM-type domain-containing protein n=1 Tax=Stieleria maiorica TaxID=2795974 RepID=A0A5B9M855_9BACT|nr:hypothetical protein [Stieleria maiorica]QEF96230.1 hypothetical protein Mal15_02570 [Stieleria maiorica]